jgi:hypothetical protein
VLEGLKKSLRGGEDEGKICEREESWENMEDSGNLRHAIQLTQESSIGVASSDCSIS